MPTKPMLCDSVDLPAALVDTEKWIVLVSNLPFQKCFGMTDEVAPLPEVLLTEQVKSKIGSRDKVAVELTIEPKVGRKYLAEVSFKKAVADANPPHHILQINNLTKLQEKDVMIKSITQVIEQNNRLLNRQTKAMANLLDNMRQAVFTCGNDLKISGLISKFSAQVFGQELKGLSVMDLLYAQFDPNGDVYPVVAASMPMAFGQDDFQWSMVEDNFPRKVPFALADGRLRSLRISYTPLWDEAKLDRIMFVVEDVTDLEALESQMQAERQASEQRMQILQEIFEVGRSDFAEFRQSTEAFLQSVSRSVPLISDRRFSDESFRALHTIKGNARALRLKSIAAVVHEVEGLLDSIRRLTSESTAPDIAPYATGVADIGTLVQQYCDIADQLNGANPDAEDAISVSRDRLTLLESACDELDTSTRTAIRSLESMIRSLRDEPAAGIVDVLQNVIDDVSDRLGKKVSLHVSGGDTRLCREQLKLLKECLVHIVRNAIDHGLESGAERLARGKSESGRLEIVFSREDDMTTVTVRDDGQGIDSARVKASAVKNGIIGEGDVQTLSAHDAIQLIFRPALTTKSEASEFSGRGVGLDYVKHALEEQGGSVSVQTTLGQGSEFRLLLPRPGRSRGPHDSWGRVAKSA